MQNIAEILSKISIPAIIYAVNFIFIFAVLFFERKSSAARLAWIMVLAFIPIVGFIFYLVFNQNLSRMHINHLYDENVKNGERITHEFFIKCFRKGLEEFYRIPFKRSR